MLSLHCSYFLLLGFLSLAFAVTGEAGLVPQLEDPAARASVAPVIKLELFDFLYDCTKD